MTGIYVGLSVLAFIFLMIYLGTVLRTLGKTGKDKAFSLKGLALPEGSIRGLLAFLVVGAFILFVFFGYDAVCCKETTDDAGNVITTENPDTSIFNSILTAFGTLTGAIAGFYFGTRGSQKVNSTENET